jgi:signal transduction histidine kinase
MTDYVREALFFAERLSPRFEVTDIGAIFKAVQGISNVRAKRRSVLLVFTSTLSEKIATDTILIQRLLVNLVSNAIDASSPNQHVAVSAEPGPPGWMRLQVADQGCGIAAEDLQKIFEPYFTTKQFGEDVRGWGLGLTICQKIVDVHEGKISVKSELGRGTIFTVDLPVSPAPVVSSNRIVSTAIA